MSIAYASQTANEMEPLNLNVESTAKINLQDWVYIHDSQHINKLSDIRSQPFSDWHKFKRSNSHKLGIKNYWVSFKINGGTTPLTRIIAIDNPLIDHIELYHFINDSLVNTHSLGDIYPFNARPIRSNIFLYPIHVAANEQHTFYIKINTKGNMDLPLTLWSSNDLTQMTEKTNLLHGFQIGLLFAISIFSLFIALASGSFSYSYYCGYVLSIALLIVTVHGVGFQFIWPNSPYIQQHILTINLPIILAFSLMFTEKALQLKYSSINMLRVCRALATASIILSFIMPFIDYSIGLYLIITAIMLVLILLAVFSLIRAFNGLKNAMLYFIGRVGLLIGGGVSGLLYFGFIDYDIKLQTPIMFGLIFEVITMAAVLAIRYNDERKEKQRIQQKALEQAQRIRESREDVLRLEEQTNEKLEHMVQERTLELEVTLRELNEVNQKLTEQNNTDQLTGVKNRHAFDRRLAAEGRISRRQQTPVGILMVDIDKFKPINDKYGHLAGDNTIQLIAKTLSEQLKRPTDLVSRFGGEEFAIILPNTTPDGAMLVAEMMRKAVSDLVIQWQGHTFYSTISIGVSVTVIENDQHPIQLLDNADQALYEAKRNGRNKVCYFEQTTE
ncbi:diguanylate cyclase domain-containing protein [Shewanella intestini]|nr:MULTISPECIES: diguanylate cyclase [Shewanella]